MTRPDLTSVCPKCFETWHGNVHSCAPHIYAVGDVALYVAGPPAWARTGDPVRVVAVGYSHGNPVAEIARADGQRTTVSADARNLNIRRPLGGACHGHFTNSRTGVLVLVAVPGCKCGRKS